MLFMIYGITTAISFVGSKVYENACNSILKREGYDFYEKSADEDIVRKVGFFIKNIIPVINIYNTIISWAKFDQEYGKYKKHLLTTKQIYVRSDEDNNQSAQQPVQQPVQQPIRQTTRQNNNSNDVVINVSEDSNAPYEVRLSDMADTEKLYFLKRELEKLGIYVDDEQQYYDDQDYYDNEEQAEDSNDYEETGNENGNNQNGVVFEDGGSITVDYEEVANQKRLRR